jgi:DNA-binding MarR family transcriptional regulator
MTDALTELTSRPGFMIRRAHQIAVSVFMEEAAELGVTTTQYGLLFLLRHRPNVDQITAARLLGLDRSTTGMVLRMLEEGGLINRVVLSADKRRRKLELTAAGRQVLRDLETPAGRAVERRQQPLAPDERPVFLRLLGKLTGALNETARVPLMDP